MGTLQAPGKNFKTYVGGSGIGKDEAGTRIGTVQQAVVPTTGAALNLTAWAGREVCIHVSAETYIRWAPSSAVVTFSAVDATSAGTLAVTATNATGGGSLYPGTPNYRDVPAVLDRQINEGVFLIVAGVAGNVSVRVEATS